MRAIVSRSGRGWVMLSVVVLGVGWLGAPEAMAIDSLSRVRISLGTRRADTRPATAGLRSAGPFARAPRLPPQAGTVRLDAGDGLLLAALDAAVLLGDGWRGPEHDQEQRRERRSDAASHYGAPRASPVRVQTIVDHGAV